MGAEFAEPENEGPLRAVLDFDGLCHDADGTGKV